MVGCRANLIFTEDLLRYLDDILEAINLIEQYTNTLSIGEFQKDTKTRDATLRNLEIIGEACKLVPETIKDRHNKIPWKKIIGLRNIVLHKYFGVDLDLIWYIITIQLPELKNEIYRVRDAINNNTANISTMSSFE